MLQEGLGQLVEAELLYQRGRPPRARYIFKHALVQDAAYQSLLRRTRQQYHRQVAELLEAQFPDVVEAQPELLAHHYTEAGTRQQGRASTGSKAGERAAQRSANPEAIAHLTNGLEVLGAMPDGPERARRELDLLTTIGPALIATKGFAAPEVEPACRRALELCEELGDTSQQFSALHGLWFFTHVRAELDAARSLAEQLVDVAKGREDPGTRSRRPPIAWLYPAVPRRARGGSIVPGAGHHVVRSRRPWRLRFSPWRSRSRRGLLVHRCLGRLGARPA